MALSLSPSRTVRICAVGSGAVTTGSWASGGKTPGTPVPIAPWQAAQLAANSRAPSAALKPAFAAGGTAEVAGAGAAAAAAGRARAGWFARTVTTSADVIRLP